MTLSLKYRITDHIRNNRFNEDAVNLAYRFAGHFVIPACMSGFHCFVKHDNMNCRVDLIRSVRNGVVAAGSITLIN